MKVERDFEEFLKYFNKHKVKYCIVGSFAVAFHARPRYTKDMDILVESSVENGKRIVAALHDFGFGNLDISEEDFGREGQIIQLGFEPVRIDVITSVSGCTFEEIWNNKSTGDYGNEKVFFIGFKELVNSKEQANRSQDKADLETLRAAKKRS